MENNSWHSEKYRRQMAVRTISVGTRIILGYILSVILIALSVYQTCVFSREGDTKNMIYYIILTAVGIGYALLVTFNMVRGVRCVGQDLTRRGEKK